jgi:hypothetical protein
MTEALEISDADDFPGVGGSDMDVGWCGGVDAGRWLPRMGLGRAGGVTLWDESLWNHNDRYRRNDKNDNTFSKISICQQPAWGGHP